MQQSLMSVWDMEMTTMTVILYNDVSVVVSWSHHDTVSVV